MMAASTVRHAAIPVRSGTLSKADGARLAEHFRESLSALAAWMTPR